uniref:heat shock 70 kDa protein II-like n=1 Tax=Styela clava TaxID=7725 RepID=UPI00193A74DD|nr:heat shock 70 kDa protein II-like [Styela clava]
MTVIGIDLGTTNSCVAVYWNNQVQIIANDQGNRVTPSYVSFTEDERLVGDAAKQEVPSNVENTLFQIKRLIGRSYDDPIVQADMKLWGFNIIDENNKPKIPIVYKDQHKLFCPEEISAMILESLKTTAEDRVGETVTDAVITVPAYFNDSQRSATRDAGKIAGLNVLRMINEPTAAAIAYGLDRAIDELQTVLVFDIGGGTFDVTIVTIKNKKFNVRATGGDSHLGGDDFDNRMVNHFVSEFNQKNYCDLSQNKRALNRLRIACEAAKRKLSVSSRATVQVDGLYNGIDFKRGISKAQFEELNYDLFGKTIQTVKDTLSSAGINKNEIDSTVLVGGSTRIPKIQELLQEFFEGRKINKTINPDEAVAYGAAALAATLSGDASSEMEELSLSDVTPLSLGWKNKRGDMVTVVKRNTTIPTEKWSSSKTGEDYQRSSHFSIYEGERAAATDNNYLGSFSIEGIPCALRGVERSEICFSIDESGILSVRARNVSTGKENQINIASRGNLSEMEIKRMTEDAERFKSEDAEWRKRSDETHKLEDFVYAVKHAVTEPQLRWNLLDKDKKKIIEKCDEIINWLNDTGNPQIYDSEEKKEELEETCRPIFAMIPDGFEIFSKFQR